MLVELTSGRARKEWDSWRLNLFADRNKFRPGAVTKTNNGQSLFSTAPIIRPGKYTFEGGGPGLYAGSIGGSISAGVLALT